MKKINKQALNKILVENSNEILENETIYRFLMKELNDEVCDIVEKYNKLPNLIKDEDLDDFEYEVIGTNTLLVNIENQMVQYNWKSPSHPTDLFYGWLKAELR
jgi:hypothetical protein